MAGKSIVRDIFVSVSRVDETPTGAPAYVFAVRPRPTAQSSSFSLSLSTARSQRMRRRLSIGEPSSLTINWRDSTTGRRYSDPSAFMAVEVPHAAPFLHEVSRTYAACRALYRALLAFSNCRDTETCTCMLGSCPFWSLHAILKLFPFPRSALLSLQWTKKAAVTHRTLAFNQFMATVLHHFQLYRDDFFLLRVSSSGFTRCKVIRVLEDFLGLGEDVNEQFRTAEHRQQLKMNLRGWESDRKNLYFCDEDSGDECSGLVEQARSTRRDLEASASSTYIDSMGVDVDEILQSLMREDPNRVL